MAVIGPTYVFRAFGTSATPSPISVDVPSNALGVAVHITASSDGVSPVNVTGLTGDFCGTFTRDDLPGALTGLYGTVAYAKVTSTGTGKTITATFGGANTLAGASAMIYFLGDIDPDDFVIGTDIVGTPDGVAAATASVTGVSNGIVIAMDTRIDTTNSAVYPGNESGFTSVATDLTTQTYTSASRLRRVTTPTTGTNTATTQNTFGSMVSVISFKGASHAASGALTGPGSTVAGSAARTRAHPSTGALIGQGSTVSGAANRTRAHTATGVLTGQGSAVAGTAARTRAHPSSGALVGPGSAVVGTAARTRAHPSSGVLVGQGSEIVGSADHQGAAGTHDATGALVGQGSTVVGSAARLRAFSSSGALVGQGSAVSGSAARVGAAVSHDATGVLVGQGSAVNGAAQLGDSIIDTHDGFWVREWKKMVEREKKLTVEEVMEIVEDSPEEVLQALPDVKKQVKKEFGRVDYQRIANNLQMQRFIAEQILVRHEIRMQELEEDDLEVLLLL